MRLIFGLIVASSLAACATPAATDTAQLADGSEKVCRFTPGVGSGAGNRVCATKADWAVHDQKVKQNSAEMGHYMIQGAEQAIPPPPPGS